MGLALLTFPAGCGGETTAPEATTTDEATVGSETIAAEPKPWAEMNMDERRAYMATDVLPRMAPLFEEFDPERFADFNCASCHGAEMEARNFAMPNPDIMPLHPTGTPEQLQMVQEKREMVTFMFQTVMPSMQELLGVGAYDPATGEGLTCFACHTQAESTAAP